MIKIAMTGHTNGLGKSLFDYFVSKGSHVAGFSRTNGYELPVSIPKIVEEAMDADVFIVNTNVAQSDLLNQIFKVWKDKRKTILVMGSRITDYSFLGIPEDLRTYYNQKLDIGRTCKSLRRISKDCRIILLRPGHFSEEVLGDNLTMGEMCNLVDYVISSSIHFEDILFQRGPQ